MTPRVSRIVGLLLVLLSILGFLTVADDLRHFGEIAAVTAILLSGISLFLFAHYPSMASHVSLAWVPLGLLIGVLVGAVTDRAVIGFGLGLLLGMLLARLLRRRGSQLGASVA